MKTILAVIALIVIIIAIWKLSSPTSLERTAIASVHYVCNEGKTIDATFYKGPEAPKPAPGQPPTLTGSASVSLSDGRMLDLYQTLSADGARYSNGDPSVEGSETFVFWTKGNGALVLENNAEKFYVGCVLVASDPGDLQQVFHDDQNHFTIRYPQDWTVDTTYNYDLLGPKEPHIPGVKFFIPATMASSTNLSDDSGLSIETMPNMPACTAYPFLIHPESVATSTISGIEYSVASSTDAAAGNRYEETIYALIGSNPCIAVRYFIHYGVYENYAPGMVEQFDRAALLTTLGHIRDSLIVVQ